jgi:hypothetical protein
VKPEVLLGCKPDFVFQSQCELSGEGPNIMIEITGRLKVHTPAYYLVPHFFSGKTAGDARHDRRAKSHCKEGGPSMR